MWADLSRRGFTNHADVLHTRRVRVPPAAAPLLTCLESCALLPGGEGQLRQRARPLLATSLVHPLLSAQSPMTHPTACVGGGGSATAEAPGGRHYRRREADVLSCLG